MIGVETVSKLLENRKIKLSRRCIRAPRQPWIYSKVTQSVVWGCLGLLEVVPGHSKPLQGDRGRNGVKIAVNSPISSIFDQTRHASTAISPARDFETENGRKIPKLQCQEKIMRTIWVSSSLGSYFFLHLLFLAWKGLFRVVLPYEKWQTLTCARHS